MTRIKIKLGIIGDLDGSYRTKDSSRSNLNEIKWIVDFPIDRNWCKWKGDKCLTWKTTYEQTDSYSLRLYFAGV